MKIENVFKKYDQTVALDGIDLEIEAGKITAVLGESGAGKTTLLAAVASLIPYEGSVEGFGRISYLFQSPKLLPHMSAEENVKFVLGKSEQAGALAMLERVGLKGKEDRLPHELSGGERQRVAIARAFLYPHDTLLMDEPFASLDLALKRSLIDLVWRLCEEYRTTVLFVTHDVREATLLASRAVVLKSGRVAGDVKIDAPYPRDFFTHLAEETALEKILIPEET